MNLKKFFSQAIKKPETLYICQIMYWRTGEKGAESKAT